MVLYSHNHDTYTCGRKINNNDGQTHFFRKIYLSHFIRNGYERVMCERWVGDWTETATYWPPVPPSLTALLSRSFRLFSRGPWGPRSLLGLVLTASNCNNWLQTNWTSSRPGYIIVWHPPDSCWRHICIQFNPSTVKAISWCFRPDAPVSRLTAGPKVNMLQLFTHFPLVLVWK